MSIAYELRCLRAELARLIEEEKTGCEHPYAGHCGDDDARADRIAETRERIEALDRRPLLARINDNR